MEDTPRLKQLAEKISQTTQTVDKLFLLGDTVYLSGPMSNQPDLNRPQFNRVKRLVAQTGATVISPADLPQGPAWEYQMRKCVRFIADCDKILMLPGWEQSKGALIEHLVACQLLIPRYYLQDNLVSASQFTLSRLDVGWLARFMEVRCQINTAEGPL